MCEWCQTEIFEWELTVDDSDALIPFLFNSVKNGRLHLSFRYVFFFKEVAFSLYENCSQLCFGLSTPAFIAFSLWFMPVFLFLYFLQTEKEAVWMYASWKQERESTEIDRTLLRAVWLDYNFPPSEKFTLHTAEQKPLSFISLTFQSHQILSEHIMRMTQQQKHCQLNEKNITLGQTCLINQSMLNSSIWVGTSVVGCVLNMNCVCIYVFTKSWQKILWTKWWVRSGVCSGWLTVCWMGVALQKNTKRNRKP